METEMKTALIVGGAGTIGLATAKLLLEDGYLVILAGRDREKLQQAQESLAARNVSTVAFDASIWDDARRGLKECANVAPELDVVINCAGVFRDPVSTEYLSDSETSIIMNGNFGVIASVTVASVPYLKARRGCIVNIAAIDAIAATSGFAVEAASKAALVAFSKGCALDLAKYGIRVNVATVGWVASPMSEPYLAQLGLKDRPLSVPLVGHIGSPEQVAEVIRFLASSRASYVNGATIVADGGHVSVLAAAEACP
jgi:NAD(P)-dependent dehydrogenase (short-subunit alcohol dehydrogenase family)